jgi:PAS domain S-box-containing protein
MPNDWPELPGHLHLQHIADAAAVPMWASGTDKQAVWFNKQWTQFVGRPLARELGAGWLENIHPDDREECLGRYDAHFEAREEFSLEFRLHRHDGVYCWFRNLGVPLRSPEGSFSGYVNTCIDITEQKRSLAALQETEDRIRLMSESAPVMLWMSDAMGRCVHLNRRLREFWNLPSDASPDYDWRGNVHPDDVDQVGAAVQEALASRSGFTVQMRLRNHRGEYRFIRTDAQAHYAPSGDFLGLIGVNIDMTEEARANQALRRSEERFARFMHHLPGLAWIKDEEGRYVFANDAAIRAFGTSQEQLIGRTDDDIFPRETAQQFRENDARAHSDPGGARFVEALWQSDGLLHHSIVSKFAIPDPDGILTGGVAIDVTDHKAAEIRIAVLNEDLRHRLEEQEALLEALPVGVFIARDRACTEILSNKTGARMLSLPEGSNASKSGPDANALPFKVYSGGRELAHHELPMQRCARLGTPINGEEMELVFSDGRTMTLHESVSPLFDGNGGVRGCVGVFVDITERKQSERQKNLFIDELNHRVKNTLAIVQSIASQTLRQTNDPKAFNSAFVGRLDALARAHSLLTTALWQGVDLADLVAVALSPFENFKGQVIVRGPSIVIRPNGAVTLALVLHELATNAAKYGALSTAFGKVAITWINEGSSIGLHWSETGGPPVGEPARKGFGSRLIAASASQLGGTANVAYTRSGVKATLAFPLEGP